MSRGSALKRYTRDVDGAPTLNGHRNYTSLLKIEDKLTLAGTTNDMRLPVLQPVFFAALASARARIGNPLGRLQRG